jgi:hypothetical protein
VSDARGPRTYGNWRRPVQPGIASLGLLGTGLVFGGTIATILAWFIAGFWWGAAAAVLFGAAIAALAMRDRHRRSWLARAATRIGWVGTRRAGAHLYRSGPLGSARVTTCQLPGVLASSTLDEYVDGFGRPFAFVHYPSTQTYVAVIRVDPQGAALVDSDDIDQWVAHFGNFLAMAGQEPGLVAAQVTVETAPDTGARLRREIDSTLADDAPEAARAVLSEVVRRYPAGASTVVGYVALTYAGVGRPGGARRTADEVARDVAASLGALTAELSAAGGGAAVPLTAAGLAEAVRVAYDPAAAEVLAELRADGESPAIDWADAGPVASAMSWDAYRHASGTSRTWVMSSPPRGVVGCTVLAALLRPHSAIERKRVTLLYRPFDPARAKDLVESDRKTADFRASGRRPSARDLSAQRAANQIAEEEARGAGLVDFGLVVTATVSDPARLEAAAGAVENAAGQSRLQLRVAHGSQDSAFAAALPVGLVVPLHLRVPSWVADAL